MDLTLEPLQPEKRIYSATCTSKYVVEIHHHAVTGFTVAVSKWQKDESGDAKLVDVVSRWESLKNEQLGTCAAYDVKSSILFASLLDRRRIITLGIGQKSVTSLSENTIREVQFESSVFSVVSLQCNDAEDEGDVVVAVSATGEVQVLCCTGNGNIAQKLVDPVPVEAVLHVSTFASDHVLIVGMRESRIEVHPVRVRVKSGFCSLKVERYPVMRLPKSPFSASSSPSTADRSILDFSLTDNYACVLYYGGFVQILRPGHAIQGEHGPTLLPWYKNIKDGMPKEDVDVARPAHSFRLSPGTAKDNSVSIAESWKDVKGDAGGVVPLPGNYIAIGYGNYVSIWDGIYGIGHAFSQINGKVTAVCTEDRTWNVLIGSENGFYGIDVTNKSRASLALSMQRKGSCDSIVKTILQLSEFVPIHSQPVAVGAMKLAAETGGPMERVFGPLMKTLDAEQMKMVRALVDRSATGSPEAVAKLTRHYTTELRKVRRGNRGRASDLGLAKLPSERLASVSVARCLYEIHFGNMKYVVPLIDMIGTGVVSSEAVLPVFELSDSWNMGPDRGKLELHSIVDPLISSISYVNGLEAIVCRVGDLPESDIVRVVQFAVQLIEERLENEPFRKSQTDDFELASDPVRRKELAQAIRLLVKCFSIPIDKKRLVEALRQIPFTDALAILKCVDCFLQGGWFAQMVYKSELPAPPPSVRRGLFFGNSFDESGAASYRGVGNWLDAEEQKLNGHIPKVQTGGCVSWGSHVIDAHLATLIMDEAGRELSGRLLKTVRQRRKQSEGLRSLRGLISHLTCNGPLPTQENALYRLSMLEVPGHAALK